MRWLVDNSVIQRMARSSPVGAGVRALLDDGAMLCSTPVTVLEAGFSARSADEHEQILRRLGGGFDLLPLVPEAGEVANHLQSKLWAAGKGRAVGARDLMIAGTAIAAGVGVLHYDSDFELLASMDERLRQRWVVSRGSVD